MVTFRFFFFNVNLSFTSLKCFLLLLVLFCLLSFLHYPPLIFLSFDIFLLITSSLCPMSIFDFSNTTSQHKSNYYFRIKIIIRIILWQSASLFLNIKFSFNLRIKSSFVVILVTIFELYVRFIYAKNEVLINSSLLHLYYTFWSDIFLIVHISNHLYNVWRQGLFGCGFETLLYSSLMAKGSFGV